MAGAMRAQNRNERDMAETYMQICSKGQVNPNSEVKKQLQEQGQLLQVLDFRKNYIGDRGARMICQCLRMLQKLQVLSIPYNGLRDGAITTLTAYITTPQAHPSLQALDLSGNEINNEPGGKAVAHMVIEDHLITELKIDNTRICEKTKASILATVSANAQNGPKNPRKNAYEKHDPRKTGKGQDRSSGVTPRATVTPSNP
jgi:Ran GTPase-activating protein (RanGAP) involved in mRNA processing and transport